MQTRTIITTLSLLLLGGALCAHAEIREEKYNDNNILIFVNDEAWQPEGFAQAPLLRAVPAQEVPVIDGRADDPVWATAEALTLALGHGKVTEATLKAVYTEEEIFLLVSWPDASKDDQYHPWVWDEGQGRYVEGSQQEDSLLVSIEAGCDWNEYPLSGYVFDFDGWRWLAARSDPVSQALDIIGHVQDREITDYTPYPVRGQEPRWVMKFDARGPGILTRPWQELGRWYLFMPLDAPQDGKNMFVSMDTDDSSPGRVQEFVERVPAPAAPGDAAGTDPSSGLVKVATAEEPGPVAVVPQYRPIKLTGDSGEVTAKGHWADGRWTVEFRRVLITPAKSATDSMFDRTTQFSIHVFDRTERLDQASESGRILLQFEP